MAAALRQHPGVLSASRLVEEGAYLLEVEKGDAVREAVAGSAVRDGWGLLEMTPVTKTLEEIYLEATRRIPQIESAAASFDGRVLPPAGSGGRETVASSAAEGGGL